MLHAGLKQLMREIVDAFSVFYPRNMVELYKHSTETDQAPVKGQVWHAILVIEWYHFSRFHHTGKNKQGTEAACTTSAW
jgi:hypothetical protein